MKKYFFVLIWIIGMIQFETYGQDIIVFDTVLIKQIQKEDSLNRIERDRINDSLEIEFYKQPRLLIINFEKNKQNIQLADNFKFWIEKGNNRYYEKAIELNKFQFDSISDTISIVFVYEIDTIRFLNICYSRIKYGADIRIGLADNLNELRTYYESRKKDRDFDEYSEIGEPYLSILENKKLKHSKNNRFQFLILTSRKFENPDILELIEFEK